MARVNSATTWRRIDTILFRGGWNTPIVDGVTHEGHSISGYSHIDPRILNDSALTKLAEVLAHELVHSLNYPGPHPYADSLLNLRPRQVLPSGLPDYSHDPYYRTIYATDSTKRCIKPRP